MTCSICLADIDEGESCCALPIVDGRCCAACDDLIVTPVRITRATALPIESTVTAALVTRRKIQKFKQSLQ